MKPRIALCLCALFVLFASAWPSQATAPASWQRAVLVYLDPQRDLGGWERHLMRVDELGHFTGQWLFDSAIVTTQSVNGHSTSYGTLDATDLEELLDDLFAAAGQLDHAASQLSAMYGPPAQRVGVTLMVPWLDPQQRELRLPGLAAPLDLSVPADRVTATGWYLDQVVARAKAAGWSDLTLDGVYYAREDAIDANGDAAYAEQFNQQAHTRGLSTVWVPYYGAPNAWNGAALGFDVVNVQPSVAFRSAQYEGAVDASRLYQVGYRAEAQQAAFEYEVSSGGETPPESWIAHQYLAIAQETGASNHPQVFFTGIQQDLFDRMKPGAYGDRWVTYHDLANYLDHLTIPNREQALPWAPMSLHDGTLVQRWTPAVVRPPMTAVRLDFSDTDSSQPWRGRMLVRVCWRSGACVTSFAQRDGQSDRVGYDSLTVPVPLPVDPGDAVAELSVSMTREPASPWPAVQRVVAVHGALPLVASGSAGELSTSPTSVQTGTYADSAPTDLGFEPGKLTEGEVSPTGSWQWPGVVGWNFYDGRFSVTIDLGGEETISSVGITAHDDPVAGVGWPARVFAAVGEDCAPQLTGIVGESCAAAGSSGAATLVSAPVAGSTSQRSGTITLPLHDVKGRYVTVTGTGTGWVLLDRIEVINRGGDVVSTGRPYMVSPTPSVEQGDRTPFAEDGSKLTSGTVVPYFGPQYAQMLTAVAAATGGAAQVTWGKPEPVGTATVWMTPPSSVYPGYRVLLPATVQMSWRDENQQWHPGTQVTMNLIGPPSPYARLAIPSGSQVTGVRVQLPAAAGSGASYMLSGISTQ